MHGQFEEYRPALNPAFVKRVHRKRARERAEASRAAERAQRIEAKETALLMHLNVRAERRFQCLIERLRGSHEARVSFAFGASKTPVIDIIEAVSRSTGIRVEDIIGVSRSKHIVAARHEAIQKVHEIRPDLSSPQIGKHFGGRDHSTILAVLKKGRAEAQEAM